MPPLSPALQKLGIEKYPARLVLHLPNGVTELAYIGADFTQQKPHYDIIFDFVFTLDALAEGLRRTAAQNLLAPNGYYYAVYPKKGNKKYEQYIHRDSIFTLPIDDDGFFETSDLKLSRMISFNDTFTLGGFKRAKRSAAKPAPSGSAETYAAQIPQLAAALAHLPDVQAAFQALTPGYQRDWVRNIYSAKSPATQAKRLEEMAAILRLGFKSKNLYRQEQNKNR